MSDEIVLRRATGEDADKLARMRWALSAESDDHVPGAGAEALAKPGRADSAIGYLTNVYVEPEHRDQGLGSRLLAGIRDEAAAVRPAARAAPRRSWRAHRTLTPALALAAA